MQNEPNLKFLEKKSRVSTSTAQSSTHIIKIWEPIGEPMDWADELDIIHTAGQYDTIVLDVCSPGGMLDTAILFHRALKNTEATTVAIIGPECSSASSIIALSCQEFVLDETSALMAHTSSWGIAGKDTDIYEHSMFSRKQLCKLFENVYSGFLSNDELSDIIKGTPMYFDYTELEKRIEHLLDYRDNLQCPSQDENVEIPKKPSRKKKS